MTAIVAEIARMEQSISIQISNELAEKVGAATQSAVRGASIGALQAVASLLAVRLLLLMALLGGFVVALMVLRLGTYQADAVLVAYAVLIVIPLVWLERNPKVTIDK